MTKRTRTSLTVLVIAAVTLAGCGSSSDAPPATPGDGSPTPTTVAPVTSPNGGGQYGY